MKRMRLPELASFLACPECGAEIKAVEQAVVCIDCKSSFGMFRNCPVLLSQSNELFQPSSYVQDEFKEPPIDKPAGIKRKLKRLIPKKSINLARDNMFQRLSKNLGSGHTSVLVVGCGNQTKQLERHFPQDNVLFVFCDIDKQADADVFCDSHALPFKSEVFDGVVSTAVMEHVLYPEKAIAEIHRVMNKDGLIYSEIPFLQSVHEGAYDFTRFTMSGHRRLLEGFEEIDSGMVAGPGTALTWSIVDFFKGLTRNQKISSLLSIAARIVFFWLKYIDHLVKNNPAAIDAASCTYFYGSKKPVHTRPSAIVKRYEGQTFGHV